MHKPGLGIRTKAMAVASMLVVITVSVSGLLVYHGATLALLNSHREMLARETLLTSQRFERFIATMRRDTLLVSELPAIAEFSSTACTSAVGTELRSCKNRAIGVLTSMIRAREAYHEIAIIGADGQELLRIHSNGESDFPLTVPDTELRTYHDTQVLRTATSLAEGQTWIADPWTEVDQALSPPRLRTLITSATPLYATNGQLFGFVLLEADTYSLSLAEHGEKDQSIRLYLSDSHGHFLFNKDTEHPEGLYGEFPELSPAAWSRTTDNETLVATDHLGAKQILSNALVALQPDDPERHLHVTLTTPHALVMATVRPSWLEISGVFGLAVLLTLPIVFFATGRVVRPLLRINTTIASWQPEGALGTLPVDRRDELGELARAFSSLIRKLSGSEARQRAAIASMQDAHVVADSQRRIVSFNPAAEKIFGYTASEVLGTSVSRLLPEPSRDKHATDYVRGRDGEDTGVLGLARELNAMRKSGEVFPVELMLSSFTVDGEQLFSAVMRDISVRKKTEERLLHLAAAIESAEECVEILSKTGEIIYINPAYERANNCTLAEVRGKRPDALREFDESDGQIAAMRSAAMRGATWHGVLRSRNSSGRRFIEDISLSPIRDREGKLSAFVAVTRDISEQLNMEQQLLRGQKLEAVGQLAAGIAHEINTPIQFVSDNIRFLKDSFRDIAALITALNTLDRDTTDGKLLLADLHKALQDADTEYLLTEIPRAVDQSLEGVDRVAKIVRAMKDFSHPATDRTPLDINRAIASTATVASNEWKYVAELETDFDPDLPQVPVMPGDFNQVILNMIVNAAHAIGDVVGDGGNGRGTITLSTRRVDDWAEIRISDTGCGMTPEVDCTHLRSLLHHQGGRQGHRPGTGNHAQRDRRQAWRHHQGRVRPRCRHHLHHPPAARRTRC